MSKECSCHNRRVTQDTHPRFGIEQGGLACSEIRRAQYIAAECEGSHPCHDRHAEEICKKPVCIAKDAQIMQKPKTRVCVNDIGQVDEQIYKQPPADKCMQ